MRVVFLLLLCAACSAPPIKPINTLSVSSAELGNAYFENEVAADERFKNALLTVSGEVEQIADRETTLHIALRSSHGITVRCFFADRAQTKKIAILKTGDLTTLSGENLGLNNRFIELKGCQII
jgi:hypothetical protein